MHEYYSLPDADEIRTTDELIFSRSLALMSAIQNYRDTELLSLWQISQEGDRQSEIFVIEIECDRVPPKNPFGIGYRERLALEVPRNSSKLVQVWALRKDFPILMHQNDSPSDGPVSLCLYFDSAASVLRTWTPQAFLRRVKWWLESSSRGELHPAEQAVEQLFFTTPYELILPWNYEHLRENGQMDFEVAGTNQRPDNGLSFFLRDEIERNGELDRRVTLLDLDTPPIVHGKIERSPKTLGELSSSLAQRGINLADILSEKISSLSGPQGKPLSAQPPRTIILVHIPIVRQEAGATERIQHQAFLIDRGFLTLGLDMGALISQPDSELCFRDLMDSGTPPSLDPISDEVISAVEVLIGNDRKRSLSQSGVTAPSPKGVVVGAGSLGATLIQLWGRSGWGEWTAIDKDHIKPHNLARHPAFFHHIGLAKTDAIAEAQEMISDGAMQITPIYGDALHINNPAIQKALTDATLAVDVSTTLEYPRYASMKNELARHVSVFVTPNGCSAVMLMEDRERKIRLRSLEAQYLRLLVSENWGQDHLGVSPPTFWSGASCRDISTVLSYSRIATHAGNLAEQIQDRVSEDQAFIGVWCRNTDTGAVEFHTTEPLREHEFEFGEFKLYVDDGVLQKLRALRQNCLPNETGGVLLGYYDFNVHMIVIADCLPAPEDSKGTRTMFERGIQGLQKAIDEASERTASTVRYLGEWHSHPEGSSSSPSRDDLYQLSELAVGMNEDGLPGIVMIIGEHDVSFLQGTLSSSDNKKYGL